MHNIKLTLCAMALAAASTSALAATQGTVTFNGQLTADTCEISPESENRVVPLPPVAIATLNGPGIEAGTTGFELNVVNCPSDITQVAAHFEAIGSSGADTATGNLTNASTDANPATNVQVRLFDADGNHLPVGSTGPGVDIVRPTPTSNGTATMYYAGGYYSTAATTAGPVYAQVRYTLAYP